MERLRWMWSWLCWFFALFSFSKPRVSNKASPPTSRRSSCSEAPEMSSSGSQSGTMEKRTCREKKMSDRTSSSTYRTSSCSEMPGSHSQSGTMQNKPKESWEIEKERYLNMPRSQRRKEYMTRSYVEYTESTFPRTGLKTPGSENTLLDKICVWQGDITSLEFDAIVNAANERMMGGGGVDGAIHKAAGKSLLEECIEMYSSGCEPGDAKLTGGYKLPADYIIHTVGPRGERPDVLESCYNSVLKIVEEEKNLKTVAFPCISTGIFGYPNEKACRVALKTVLQWLQRKSDWDGRIVFCVFLDKDKHIYDKNVKEIFADPESAATKEALKDLPTDQPAGVSSDPDSMPTLNVDNSRVSPSDQTTEDNHATITPVEDNPLSKEPSTSDNSESKLPCEEDTNEGEAISADVEPQSNEALEPPDSGEDGGGEIASASPLLCPNEHGDGEVSPSPGAGQQQVDPADVTTGLAGVDKDSSDKSTV